MIREATWEDVIEVVKNMRSDDFDEVMATRWDDCIYSFATEIMRYPSNRVVGLVDNRPVVIGGLARWQPGVGQAWLVGTADTGLIGRQIASYCKQEINNLFAGGQIHRIQAFSSRSHKQAHAWMRAIGLREESIMPKFGKNGEDFIVFSKTKETL